MARSFEFATAQQIVFGAGAAGRIAAYAAEYGDRAFVVTGARSSRVGELGAAWRDLGLAVATFEVTGEPSVGTVLAGVTAARAAACNVVIAIGGGSAIDTGKAVSALLTNPGDPLDYLEVVGKGRQLAEPSAPLVAAPTTAGTGAEVTRNAVLAVPEHQVKVSLRSATMLPKVAVIDPELTYSMPASVTASTGLDALTQCIEPFVSSQANPLTDGLAREGIAAAAHSLRRAYADGDPAAREGMALASLCGGLALANAKLGAVHGFAGVLGGMFPVPHGIVCARLLPFVAATNVAALQSRAPQSPALARYDEIGRLATGRATAVAGDGVAWIEDLCDALSVPRLREYGLRTDEFDDVIAKSKVASSMKGNPVALTDEELRAILKSAL